MDHNSQWKDRTDTSSVLSFDFARLLKNVFRKLWLALLIGALCGAAAWILVPKVTQSWYNVSYTVYVTYEGMDQEAKRSRTADLVDLTNTYSNIAQSRDTLQEARKEARAKTKNDRVDGVISTETWDKTQVVCVKVNGTDAKGTYEIAVSAKKILERRMNEVIGDVRIETVEKPVKPDAPYAPDRKKLAEEAAGIGAAVVLILVLIKELCDRRVRDPKALEQEFRVPVVAVVSGSGESARKEEFAEARAKISMMFPEQERLVLGLTPVGRGEDAAAAAAALAASFANLGKKVLLVDGDLRREEPTEVLGSSKTPGLAEVLRGKLDWRNAVMRQDAGGFDVLGAGEDREDPLDLLQSEQFGEQIEAFRGAYDEVIVALPPARGDADAAVEAAKMDGFLMTVREFGAKIPEVRNALTELAMEKSAPDGFLYLNRENGPGKRDA